VDAFIAYDKDYLDGEGAFLIVVDGDAIRWLSYNFEKLLAQDSLAATPIFVIGNGDPIESDGRCLVSVMPDRERKGTRICQVSETQYNWTVSEGSVHRYVGLLQGLDGGTGQAGHQYLDSDDPASPTVIVSRGEYDVDWVRTRILKNSAT